MSIGQVRCRECGNLRKAVSSKVRAIQEMRPFPDPSDPTKTVMKPVVVAHVCRVCDTKKLKKMYKESLRKQQEEAKKEAVVDGQK